MKKSLLVAFCIIVVFAITGCNSQSTAPNTFNVLFETSIGNIELTLNRSWAPVGVDHFYDLIQANYYDQNAFFRVIQSPRPFVAQWGIAADPDISAKWNFTINDDPVVGNSNTIGTISYAAEMNSNNYACCRTTQLFINFGDNSFLDSMGFVPFGYVKSGLDVAMKFYSGYGEQPDQTLIYSEGNSYLQENFPLLDYLTSATIINDK
ncbi:hypothetical protein CYY_004729 [Polysphondylium violaceum]|uniref:peptidylprolyl isomerase n=1 Tax=Polysphondylium violaceum TaxID=133409 RepID=A0A8J4PUM3_9MYCE|nr:hypothetical protein CYY_004729 [Polysphondylium violaceum]